MRTNHHPDDATLLSYAAGSLPESFEILVGCHLRFCEHCRSRIHMAETIGVALMERTPAPPVSSSARDAFMAQLDDDTPSVDDSITEQRPHRFPAALTQFLEEGDHALAWKRLVPGIQQIMLPCDDGGLRLLKIAPGVSIPLHTHAGSELTLILQGSYSDEMGRFCRGDVADLDPEVEHQPITDRAEACICLVATDAPLKFKGFLPKLLQPFTGF